MRTHAHAVNPFPEGVVEVWLTSEDTGAYGIDLGTDLPTLLRRLVNVVPEGCRLRLGMTNPPYILQHLAAVAEVLNHPRVYKFIHVPVQSGSDTILGEMAREYCVEDFATVVDTLRRLVPGLTVATDIICGFPGETEEDFEETRVLVEKYEFPSLFVNQFFPRPGTPAARLPRVDPRVVKTRTRALAQIFAAQRPYENLLGTRQTLLVTEVATDGEHLVGHDPSYVQVLVPRDVGIELGDTVTVDIVRTGKHFVVGQVVPGTRRPKPTPALAIEEGNSAQRQRRRRQQQHRDNQMQKQQGQQQHQQQMPQGNEEVKQSDTAATTATSSSGSGGAAAVADNNGWITTGWRLEHTVALLGAVVLADVARAAWRAWNK